MDNTHELLFPVRIHSRASDMAEALFAQWTEEQERRVIRDCSQARVEIMATAVLALDTMRTAFPNSRIWGRVGHDTVRALVRGLVVACQRAAQEMMAEEEAVATTESPELPILPIPASKPPRKERTDPKALPPLPRPIPVYGIHLGDREAETTQALEALVDATQTFYREILQGAAPEDLGGGPVRDDAEAFHLLHDVYLVRYEQQVCGERLFLMSYATHLSLPGPSMGLPHATLQAP